MKKKGRLKAVIFLVSLAFMLSSCVLTSDNPLGSIESAIDDPAIKGLWCGISEEGKNDGSYLAILDGKEGYLQLMSFSDKSEGVVVFRGFVTQIGEDRYLNMQYVGDIGGNMNFGKGYIFMHYSIDPSGNLAMSVFSESFFKKAIKEGMLKGEVEKIETQYGYRDGEVKIKAPTDELVNFIKKCSKKEYLSEPTILRKLHIEN